MRPLPIRKETRLRASHQGISLVEVMLIISLLSAVIIPSLMFASQNSQTARGAYIQSSRSIILNSLADEMSPRRSNFASLFNTASKVTSLSESGQVIPYRRQVDTSSLDIFSKRVYLYLYNNQSDADSSPRSRTTVNQMVDVYRINAGSTEPIIDERGNVWYPDTLYDASTGQPGYTNAGNTSIHVADIPNTTGRDDSIYLSHRRGLLVSTQELEYKFNVANGTYTVELHFSDDGSAAPSISPNRRFIEIYLEGARVSGNHYYSIYDATGGVGRAAHIQMYDVAVSDGVLDLLIDEPAISDLRARIYGIVIRKRRMQ